MARIIFVWCGWRDLNPHGCPLDPKSSASANFATSAYSNHGIKFIVICLRLVSARLTFGAPIRYNRNGDQGIIAKRSTFALANWLEGALWRARLPISPHPLVAHPGFEPGTPWLKVMCSTNWANEPRLNCRNYSIAHISQFSFFTRLLLFLTRN